MLRNSARSGRASIDFLTHFVILELEVNMQNPNDYRQWPNVLAINAEIKEVGLKIAKALDTYEYVALKQKQCELLAKRYDQIQFNKAMAEDIKKVS